MYSFGIVLNEIKIHFQVTQDVVNLVQSLNVGFLFLSGPISSGLASQFGCRVVVMISGFVFGLMYALCAFLPSIYIMIGTFGVIGGVAFGCTYLTCFIILVDFFDKKLGIANGLTMAGSGLGAFAFAPLTKLCINYFGWQSTMVIMGSITLQCCVLGALLRPVEHFKAKRSFQMMYC
jgi:MCP family monocarboxylic acid transporter-like MFS transporter 14